MGKFEFGKTAIEGVYVITPTVFGDARGYFMETYNESEFHAAGIMNRFVQDNQSASHQGVLRGLHFQKQFQQAKLVRVISGAVYDVAVDLRRGSPTWGQYVGVTLSADEKNQFFIPRGFAHGFLVLSEKAEFVYKCDELYHPEDEGGIAWDDEKIGIIWPNLAFPFCLSEKDKHRKTLKDGVIEL